MEQFPGFFVIILSTVQNVIEDVVCHAAQCLAVTVCLRQPVSEQEGDVTSHVSEHIAISE